MNTLPFDYWRCHPEPFDDDCNECMRFADSEGQTFGSATPHQTVVPNSVGCQPIPIKWEPKTK
jgi:hypothetical protein